MHTSYGWSSFQFMLLEFITQASIYDKILLINIRLGAFKCLEQAALPESEVYKHHQRSVPAGCQKMNTFHHADQQNLTSQSRLHIHFSVEGPVYKCSLKCNQPVSFTCHFPQILHLMELKDLLPDLIARGFIQKHQVFT